MHLKNLMVFLVIFSIVLGGGAARSAAAPKGKGVEAPNAADVPKTMPDGPPPLEEHRIDLAPFFLLQQNGPHVWLERVIVTFMMAAPKDSLKDMNSPNFRKMMYDLLHSGKPEPVLHEQAAVSLNRQLGMNLEATVQVSRSVIIVR